MPIMAKKRKPQEGGAGGDRHKPRYMVGLPARLIEVLDIICERNVTDRTTEVARAVRLMLEAEGLWPPKPTEGQEGEAAQDDDPPEEKPARRRKR